MPSIRSHFWRFIIKRLANYNKPLSELRLKFEKDTRYVSQPKDVRVTQLRVEGVPAEWLEPTEATPNKVLLYLHGGGYVMGSCAIYRGFASRLAKSCGLRTLLLDYRLAPEHPFPAALDDSLAAYEWLLEQGVSPKNIVVAGDSAGGGLTLATLISLRDNNKPLPAMAFCISPWTDLALTGDSINTCAEIDPYVSHYLLGLGAHYIGDNDPRLPLISPLYADLQGLPTLLIHVGSDEIMLDDATRFAEAASVAGVNVTLKIWERMWHVFHFLAPRVPEASRAIEEIGQFVTAHWSHTD